MPRGGARQGAGRKPRAERFAKPIAAAEKRIADKLPLVVDTLLDLGTGVAKRVETTFAAAGTLKRQDVARDPDTGDLLTDMRGNPVKVEVPMFPDRDPEELVLTGRKEIEIGPDRAAAEYLTDRILGKPVALVEAELSGPDGAPLHRPVDLTALSDQELVTLEQMLRKASTPEPGGSPAGDAEA